MLRAHKSRCQNEASRLGEGMNYRGTHHRDTATSATSTSHLSVGPGAIIQCYCTQSGTITLTNFDDYNHLINSAKILISSIEG